MAPCEQGRQVRTQEERVRSREVDIPSATRVNAVNCFLETLEQLHLVDEEAVAGALFVPPYDLAMQRVVLEQRLVVEVQQVDVDVVGGRVLPSNGGGERLHELGLAGATHPVITLMPRVPSSAQSHSMYDCGLPKPSSTPSWFRNSNFFKVSKPREQYCRHCNIASIDISRCTKP